MDLNFSVTSIGPGCSYKFFKCFQLPEKSLQRIWQWAISADRCQQWLIGYYDALSYTQPGFNSC